jgi:hypothetical protein
MAAKPGNQYAKGCRALTADEKAARDMQKLDLMDILNKYMFAEQAELERLKADGKTLAKDAIAINLIMVASGKTLESSVPATKIILDRICGPVKQTVEIKGSLFDFSQMTKEQKVEMLNELRKSRGNTGAE